jgi:hypothetical protein
MNSCAVESKSVPNKEATEPMVPIGYVEVIPSIYGCFHDLVNRDAVSMSHMTTSMFRLL